MINISQRVIAVPRLNDNSHHALGHRTEAARNQDSARATRSADCANTLHRDWPGGGRIRARVRVRLYIQTGLKVDELNPDLNLNGIETGVQVSCALSLIQVSLAIPDARCHSPS